MFKPTKCKVTVNQLHVNKTAKINLKIYEHPTDQCPIEIVSLVD